MKNQKSENCKIDKEIGRKIKLRRKELGLTQKELAKSIGITQGSICDYEKGRYSVPFSLMKLLATKLKISLEFLFSEEDIKKLSRKDEELSAGERIRKKRIELALTQKELAKSIGVNQEEISLYERSKKKISMRYIQQLARKLNATVCYLLGEK